MALSPTVNAYMQPQAPQQPGTAEGIFSNSFSQQAYNTLQAKYPALTPLVVTFRVLDSDADKGNAFGVFILRCGDDVRYIPAVMSGGLMTSVEMVYDRDEDTLAPLTEDMVKALSAAAMHKDHELLSGKVRVEDTKGLMRNMVRPPVSSEPVMASSRLDISVLPNAAKDALFNYYTEHKDLLGKVAEFYPVDKLASSLAPAKEVPSTPEVPEVISLDSLTKQAAELLTQDERTHILEHGYVVKHAADDDDAPNVAFNPDVITLGNGTLLGLHEYALAEDKSCGAKPLEAVKALCVGKDGFFYAPALLTASHAVFKDGAMSFGSSWDTPKFVMAQSDDPVTPDMLKELGFTDSLSDAARRPDDAWPILYAAVPSRSGYKLVEIGALSGTDARVTEDEGSTTVSLGYGKSLTETDAIEYGVLCSGSTKIVPKGTMYYKHDDKAVLPPVVHTLGEFLQLLDGIGTRLKVTSDGVSTQVTDNKTEKTASFMSKTAAAQHLADKYGLTAGQIDDVLSRRDTVVFSKRAFGEEMAQMSMQADPAAQQPMPYMQEMPAPAMQMAPQPVQAPQFAPQSLEDFAMMNDPEIMDAGMLASFANDPDIKTLLVDYYPDFVTVLDRIGRIILLFCLDTKGMEEFYGKEQLANLLGSMRRVFKTVGDITADLRKYINMM